MRHNLALPLLACGLLVTGCVEPATGPPQAEDPEAAFARGGRPFLPGERQDSVDLVNRGLLIISPEDAGQNLAQTFSPPKNQLLGFLELPVGCEAGVLLNVKIREGLDGPILYEVNVSGLPRLVDGTFQLLQVYDPDVSRGTRLRKDRTYAFELASFPEDPNVPPNCYHAQGGLGDLYARGQGFFEDEATSPGLGWQPLPNGLPTDSEDLPFRTLVR